VGIKFFGQYLLEKGMITAEQLLEASSYQESKNLRFGEYARSRGYLTDRDIRRIQEEQRHTDMLFGELAVRLGILTPEAAEEILTRQKNDHLYIGEALVEKNFISREALDVELSLFREDQKDYAPGVISVPSGVRDPQAVRDAVDLTKKMFLRVARLEVKVGDGFMSMDEPGKNFASVSVRISGKGGMEYALSTSREVSAAIYAGLLGEAGASESDEELVVDSVKEFCNITCGNILARMAQRGHSAELHPPREDFHLGGRTAVRYPLYSTSGDISLIILEG
jgi:CheY-specific phosphatase CheX